MLQTIYLDQNVLSDLRYRKLKANPISPFAYIYIRIKEQKCHLLYSDVHLKEIKQITKKEYIDEHIHLLHDTMAIHIDHELQKLDFVDPHTIWDNYNQKCNNSIEQSVNSVFTKLDKKLSGVKVDETFKDLFTENAENAQAFNSEAKRILSSLKEEDFKDTGIDFNEFQKNQYVLIKKQLKEQQKKITNSIEEINFDGFKSNNPDEAKQWFRKQNINFDEIPSNQILPKIMKLMKGYTLSLDSTREKVRAYYKLLNLFGYHMDDYRSLRKGKDRFNASQNDMEHVANGYHAGFFISNDGNLNKKAKAVYSYMNIPTRVLTPEEFKEVNLSKE